MVMALYAYTNNVHGFVCLWSWSRLCMFMVIAMVLYAYGHGLGYVQYAYGHGYVCLWS